MSFGDDLQTIAKGWRWGHPRVLPQSAGIEDVKPKEFPTAWARKKWARAAREVILQGGFDTILRAELTRSVFGLEFLDEIKPPAVFVSNHTSHLDAPLLLTSLPGPWRRRAAVGAAADYFFDVWWRAVGTALAFNTFPIERSGARRSFGLAKELLGSGWSLIIFPEGTRSKDGWMGEFKSGAGALSTMNGVPVVPVAIRGSYQAMPRGRGWPAPGKPPVAVRFGRPLFPEPGERASEMTERIRQAIQEGLLEEDTTWWEARRKVAQRALPDYRGPEGAGWRRSWESDRPVREAGADRVWDD